MPQQFPRRLYLMLESEGKLQAASSDHVDLISWSDSGKAFKITNVAAFASDVLPKYFRTSKFSSFQRNLNLYGFTKARRGPDMDMYTHPSFMRGHPEMLGLLRKNTATGTSHRGKNAVVAPAIKSSARSRRAVSPSPPSSPGHRMNMSFVHSNVDTASSLDGSKFYLADTSLLSHRSAFRAPTEKLPGAGRLDLLTMALTTLAEREQSL